MVIIGGGPAGLSAAIYSCRGGLNVVLIEKKFAGGQLLKANIIENYPGFPDGVPAIDLAENMRVHAESCGAEFRYGDVYKIQRLEDSFKIIMKDNILETKSIIIATGRTPRSLEILNEDKFIGHGISYCATCDGAFFKNKCVAVVGGGNTAISDAIYLSSLCEKVFLIHRRDEFRAEKYLINKMYSLNNIKIVTNSVITKLIGTDILSRIEINKSGILENINVSCLFIAIGYVPNTIFLDTLINLDKSGNILVDNRMLTNVNGIFAAGDVIHKPLAQIITSAAEGATAANSAIEYVRTYLNTNTNSK